MFNIRMEIVVLLMFLLILLILGRIQGNKITRAGILNSEKVHGIRLPTGTCKILEEKLANLIL